MVASPDSDYDAGYHGSYLGEGWARPEERRRGVDGDLEEQEEGGCWCRDWWVMNGSSTMPWVAYYVF